MSGADLEERATLLSETLIFFVTERHVPPNIRHNLTKLSTMRAFPHLQLVVIFFPGLPDGIIALHLMVYPVV